MKALLVISCQQHLIKASYIWAHKWTSHFNLFPISLNSVFLKKEEKISDFERPSDREFWFFRHSWLFFVLFSCFLAILVFFSLTLRRNPVRAGDGVWNMERLVAPPLGSDTWTSFLLVLLGSSQAIFSFGLFFFNLYWIDNHCHKGFCFPGMCFDFFFSLFVFDDFMKPKD